MGSKLPASKKHASENCEGGALRCANCKGNHPAYSRLCPRWKNEREIITVKTKQDITFKEARRHFHAKNSFNFSTKTNFADVVRRGGASHDTPASAQATSTEPMAVPSTPQARIANAALPYPKQGAPAHGSAPRRTSPRQGRPETNTSAALRSSSTYGSMLPSTSALDPRQTRFCSQMMSILTSRKQARLPTQITGIVLLCIFPISENSAFSTCLKRWWMKCLRNV
ncbi:hypothetical protein V5799_025066 [Amblyomma americanum]|uniref:Uncharacterized protein n=1 Tax=Amblyomma americanum TaxID=6943 RepID=A0AAQ4EAM6_AMBAM